jgi:hypothetical protein
MGHGHTVHIHTAYYNYVIVITRAYNSSSSSRFGVIPTHLKVKGGHVIEGIVVVVGAVPIIK